MKMLLLPALPVLLFFASCSKHNDELVNVPASVTTMTISTIGSTEATGGGNISSTGSATITSTGLVWGITSNPATDLATSTDFYNNATDIIYKF